MAAQDLTLAVVRFRVGDLISRTELLKQFHSLNYHETKTVEEPGEHSVRGGTVDVYPLSYRAPVRIQFQLDRIESIRDYSLHEGKSLTTFEEIFLLPVSEAFLRKRDRLRSQYGDYEPLAGLEDIRPGDFVVHVEYGIAQFLGTKALKISGRSKRCLALEFDRGEILFLPF